MRRLSTIFLGLILTSVCIADTWTVDDDGKADFDNIQAAINAASDGDTVLVSAGVYIGNQDEVVNLLGKAVTLQSVSGAGKTIIDGNGKRRGILCENGETSATVIEGFTIQNCIAPWLDWDGDNQIDSWEYAGAGMGNRLSDPTILHCIFQNNAASQSGGGMMNFASSPAITNCSFDNNSADSLGGGMYNYSNSHPIISLSSFTSNTSAHLGGGMYNRYLSNTVLSDTTFDSNTAVNGGGGIYNSAQADIEMTDCTISNNSVSNVDGFGGGLVFFNSSPTLTNCTVASNSALSDGGGVYGAVGSNISMQNCDVSNNVSGDAGSGLFLAYLCTSTIVDSLIQNNSGGEFGGGLFIYETVEVELNNTSVELNSATVRGGGIWSSRHNSIRLEDSTIDNNTATSGEDILAEKDSLVQFAGANVIGDLEILYAGTKIEFLPNSNLTISGSLTPPAQGAIAFDIGNLNAPAPLTITGELVRQGSLSVTNNSNSLNNANIGQIIPLMQVTTLSESVFDSIVVPDMPKGKGLRIIANASVTGGSTDIAAEVVEVEDVEFDDPILAGLDGPPIDMVSCDIDGDGADEVAILFSGFPGSVVLFTISDDGSAPAYIEGSLTDVGNVPVDIDSGDIDGDGVEELLITNSIDSTLSLLQNVSPLRGTLVLTEKVIPISGNFQVLSCAAIIDWDGDSDRDAVVGVDQLDEDLEDRYQVVRSLGSDTPINDVSFNISKYELDDELVSDSAVAVDGANETAFGFVGGTTYGRVHRGTEDRGTLTLLGDLNGNRIMFITAKDLDDGNGDGQVDLVVASDEAESIFLFQGDSNEPDGFGNIIAINVTLDVSDVVAIDADSDGDIDFVITAPEAEEPLVLLRNDGTVGLLTPGLGGRTWSKQNMGSYNPPRHIAGGGLTGKEEDDDWISGAGNQNSALLGDEENSLEQTNIIAAPCPTDVNGDGLINIDDLLLVIAAWGECVGCQEDFNGDGVVNIDDVLVIIGAWGVCP